MSRRPSRHEAPDSKSARTRRRILDSAVRELARHGYGGTSLRNVAAGADLQMPSLYFHFASKDDLVAAAMADGIESTAERIEEALSTLPDGTSPTDRISVAIAEHLDALQSSHDHATAVIRMAGTLPAGLRDAQEAVERQYVDLWADLLAAGQREGVVDPAADPDVLAAFVIGGLNSHLSTAGDGERARSLAALVTALLIRPSAD